MRSLIPFIISTITVFSFQNCAVPEYDVKYVAPPLDIVSDAIFAPYIQDFADHYGKDVNVPIVFKPLDSKWAGMCYRTIVNGIVYNAYIEINQLYWKQLSEYQRIGLIFHELGHCVLNREHVESNSVMLCPTSFMYPSVLTNFCVEKHYQEYIKEMFHE